MPGFKIASERQSGRLRALFLAHLLGSFVASIPAVVSHLLQASSFNWLWLLMAPVVVPIYLIATMVTSFPTYDSYLTAAWLLYLAGFVCHSMINRYQVPLMSRIVVPAAMTIWVLTFFIVSGGLKSFSHPVDRLIGSRLQPLSLQELSGKCCLIPLEKAHVVFLAFWGSTCPPCRIELKHVVSSIIADESLNARGLNVWAIDVTDDATTAQKFLVRNQLGFDTLIDSRHITSFLHVDGIPVSYVIGRNHVIEARFSGAAANDEIAIRAAIESALNRSGD